MVPKNKAEAIFHPIRIRVVQALFGEQGLTARQLQSATGVASLATLYRHLKHLVSAGIIAVVEERPVRGTLEKVYAITNQSAVRFQPDEWQRISPEDQLRYFNTLVGSLLHDFGRYIAQPHFDRGADGVLTRQAALNLTDDEAKQLAETLREAVDPYVQHAPDPTRRRRVLTAILLPIVEQPSPEETL
jgi:DNA-binding transcriptional ArsR family regulator